jgi:SAM-dependent methyltransferase
MAEVERWNQVYREEPHLYSAAPNALLMEVAGAMPPGRALDIGMGQGRNAAWLADRGWDVTGLDPAEEGIRQAASKNARVRLVHSTLEDFTIEPEAWDLIAGIYVHGVMLRESARVIDGLAKGGRLFIEGFHRDVMKLGIDGMTGGLLGYKSNALLRKYLALRIERYEECTALADWRKIEAPLVRMVARKEE